MPKCNWYTIVYNLNNFVTRKEPPKNELIRRNDDREDWKDMIVDVCNSYDDDDSDDDDTVVELRTRRI